MRNSVKIEDVLAEANCLISGDRQDTYGDIRENWERTGMMFAAILNLAEPIPAETVGIMFASMKLSRMVNDPTHLDNYIDAVAYIAGAAELATE